MEVTTRAEAARRAAKLWRAQCFHAGEWKPTITGSSELVYNEIVKAAGNPDAIDLAIGNDRWTRLFCSECSKYKDAVVSLGYEESSADVCADCLHKALSLMEKENG